jgi:hypothetical protein
MNHPRSLAGQWNLTKQFIWLRTVRGVIKRARRVLREALVAQIFNLLYRGFAIRKGHRWMSA